MTSASLEKFDFGTVDTKNRLMGVTVCAPGFSLETNSLSGAGILQVQEQFDVMGSAPKKVISVVQNDTSYLFDLHGWGAGELIRIGERFINGSPIAANEYNNNSVNLRYGPVLPETDVKIYNGESFKMIAYYTDYKFLVLDNSNVLRLFTVGTQQAVTPTPAGIKSDENPGNAKNITIYPNPATEWISIRYSGNLPINGQLIIYSLDGKEAYKKLLTAKNQQIPVSSLQKGVYFVSVMAGEQKMFQDRLVIN